MRVASASDYYPFGMGMPQRTYNSPDYRYGFNGKEKDESGEWGNLTNYDYGFRIYNPGIGKFLSVDPLTQSYPMLTPYQFASNTPIQAIDLDGLEAKASTVLKKYHDGKIEKVTDIVVKVKVVNNSSLATGSEKFKEYLNAVLSDFETRMTASFHEGARQFNTKIDHQIVKQEEIKSTDFVFSFEDQASYTYIENGVEEVGYPKGYVEYAGETQSNVLHLSLGIKGAYNSPKDVGFVATHELAHALGLTHVFWSEEALEYDLSRKGWDSEISSTYVPFLQSFKILMGKVDYLEAYESGITDFDQVKEDAAIEAFNKLHNNLMTSGANSIYGKTGTPDVKILDSKGELTEEQFESMKKVIDVQDSNNN